MKQFMLFATTITILLLAMSCNTPPLHVHTFDETRWVNDETHHWHPATCGHTNERKDVAEHTKDSGTVL